MFRLVRPKRAVIAALLGTLLTAGALSAPVTEAQTLPGSSNLVALATPDMQVAVTFWAPSTPQTRADAGAFATMAIQQWGLVGIANFAPETVRDSTLVCQMPLNQAETVGVYGIRGIGVTEAGTLCQSLEMQGAQIIWS